MIQWVYERTRQARGVDRVIVATDDERIAKAVRQFGGEAVMTSPDLLSGTDRVAAVSDTVAADIYVNVQGDEPLIDPRAIEATLDLVRSGRFGLATAMIPLKTAQELSDPNVVKVLVDRQGRAIYFSRHPIPYSRGEIPHGRESPADHSVTNFASQRHVGLYVYSRETLAKFRALLPSPIEQGEMLEQLRALENGIAIGVAQADFECIGVDTPDDLEKVRKKIDG
jgi:3-deoxy-manno-octulosonate cytidylyltransferase (CMP-KDO synthetase)